MARPAELDDLDLGGDVELENSSPGQVVGNPRSYEQRLTIAEGLLRLKRQVWSSCITRLTVVCTDPTVAMPSSL